MQEHALLVIGRAAGPGRGSGQPPLFFMWATGPDGRAGSVYGQGTQHRLSLALARGQGNMIMMTGRRFYTPIETGLTSPA